MITLEETVNIIGRSILTLIVLFLLAKMMGKKQISQLNLFDYIVGITIGSIAADISLDIEKSFIGGLVSLFIYGISAVIISLWALKSLKIRRFFLGVPTVLIEDGLVIVKNLKKVKFNVNDLMEEARNAGYFNLDEIAYAVMESNGRVSFLQKDINKPVTKKDMNLKESKSFLVANVLINGVILEKNLMAMDKNKDWLLKQLKVLGYNSINDIEFVTLDKFDKIIVYKKDEKSKYETILE